VVFCGWRVVGGVGGGRGIERGGGGSGDVGEMGVEGVVGVVDVGWFGVLAGWSTVMVVMRRRVGWRYGDG